MLNQIFHSDMKYRIKFFTHISSTYCMVQMEQSNHKTKHNHTNLGQTIYTYSSW